MSNFYQRIIASLLIGFFVLGSIYLSGFSFFKPIFALFTAGVIATALWEFYRIAKVKGYSPLSGLGIIGTIAYAYSVFLISDINLFCLTPFIIILGLIASGFAYFFFTGVQPLANLSITFFGFAYLTIPLSLIISINFDYGQAYLVYLIVVTKFTDTGAYFTGKKLGRHKFAPYISPNKTWEGALGGFLLGMAASYLIGTYIGFSQMTALILGGFIAAASIFGDLTESLLKRDVGVKDSSQLPGLGGMLDVVDSLIFTTPIMYFYFKIMEIA